MARKGNRSVFAGKKVSIISRKRVLSLSTLKTRLGAKEVVFNERDADVYLVDNELTAEFKAPEGKPVLNSGEYEDLLN